MATKKRVLGADPLSWIKKTDDKHTDENEIDQEKQQNTSLQLPKYETYEVKLTVRLSESHLEFLSYLEREIMKSRSKKNRVERITKNSIIRSILDVFKNLDYEKAEIPTEKELTKRIQKGLENFNN